jgi:hypothetical protein
LELYWLYFSGVGVILHNPPANGHQGPIPEEMSETQLTNFFKSKEAWTKYTPVTLLRQRQLALTARNTLFWL